jgi:CRP-like cAMP-binding protein
MPREHEPPSIPAPAFDVLRVYLEARAAFSDDDVAFIRGAFLFRRLRAGEFLQRAGDITRFAAFVASGCLRNYVLDPKGKEHIVQFAPETWWLADATSLNNRTPSLYFIDAVEDSELLLIDGPSHQKLVDGIPSYAAAFRKGLQRHAAAKDQRIVSSFEGLGRGALPRVPERLSVNCAPGSSVHDRLVSRHDAGDRQPNPQEVVPQVVPP